MRERSVCSVVKSVRILYPCPLRVSLALYAVRMLFFGLALLIAARPDLDNPGCYRDGWDYFRGICEGISIIFFVYKIIDEIVEMLR